MVSNNVIPFSGYKAMTVWPFIFVRKNVEFNDIDKNHESIHGRQQIECHIVICVLLLFMACLGLFSFWWLFCTPLFYFIWYGIEYFIRCLAYGNDHVGYRNISFEQEAYMNEIDFYYLPNRKPFAWVKYLGKKTYSLFVK